MYYYKLNHTLYHLVNLDVLPMLSYILMCSCKLVCLCSSLQLTWALLDIYLQLFQHIDSYSATKAEGERLVIKANGANGLLTCCLRPSSIFGPGDRLLVPSLVDAARAGKSKVACLMSLLIFISSPIVF